MEIKKRELSPGVELLAIETQKFKSSFFGLSFFLPLREETAAQYALIPFLLRRGSQEHPDMESISGALDDLYGGAIEPMVRKKGEAQCVGFLGSFLDDAYALGRSGILESAANLMGELLLSPKGENGFDEHYLDSEKENLKDRMRARLNDKQRYAMYRLVQEMCKDEAFGIDGLGEEAAVSSITNEGLFACYQAMIKEAPLLFYYCGSTPVEEVERVLRKAFAPLLAGSRQAMPEVAAVPNKKERVQEMEEAMDVTQGKLVFGFRSGKACTSPDRLAQSMVFNAIYGGSTNSKLFANVRERLSLCYYASSGTERHKGFLFVSSGIAFEQYKKAREEILAQLEDCKEGRFDQQDLEIGQRYVVNNLKATKDAQGRLEEYWLSQFVTGELVTPEQLVKEVESVTKEQVCDMAKGFGLDTVYFLKGKQEARE